MRLPLVAFFFGQEKWDILKYFFLGKIIDDVDTILSKVTETSSVSLRLAKSGVTLRLRF